MAQDYKKIWTEKASKHLVGKKIKSVRYLTDDEVESQGWDSSSLVIELDSGELLWISQDDEGNGPGAIFTTIKDLQVIPTI